MLKPLLVIAALIISTSPTRAETSNFVACLPQKVEYTTLKPILVLQDLDAINDPNPQRPLEYHHILNVFDGPMQGRRVVSQSDTLIMIYKDGTCKRANTIDFELVAPWEIALQLERNRQEIEAQNYKLYQEGFGPPGDLYADAPEVFGQQPCRLTALQATVTIESKEPIEKGCEIRLRQTPDWAQ